MEILKIMSKKYNKKILIVAAHTDDETLGMGGTIARHIKNGDEVFAISMTNGVASRNESSQIEVEFRVKASNQAAQKLGFKWLSPEQFPDNAMDTIPLLDIVKSIENVKYKINPSIIYCNSSADLNIDHRITAEATLTAFRPQHNETWHEIRLFEVPSSTDFGYKAITNSFTPNLYINIADTFNLKIEALKEYDQEIKQYPNSRSYKGLENLAKYRGNQVGLYYAEAFEVIRKIER